jgi:hypothetical protein
MKNKDKAGVRKSLDYNQKKLMIIVIVVSNKKKSGLIKPDL